MQDSWKGFTMPMWEDQPVYLLISLEKDALSRLVSRVANKYSVRTFPTRGYPSFSYVQAMANYMQTRLEGKPTIVLYFGDFDPSGVDIERDLEDRLGRYGAKDFKVKRIALTADQIKHYRSSTRCLLSVVMLVLRVSWLSMGINRLSWMLWTRTCLQETVEKAIRENIDVQQVECAGAKDRGTPELDKGQARGHRESHQMMR